ncbi:hypothetical protein SAMN05216553_10653 [Lentzea fradiae]|uniref:Uncharacterized protein n=1 Tax=Lentzea fradiae TaxID=200378 RepID=A0A1G7S590_9PSEU|nr:hypothetical protein [Lentzea fradiae]SDG18163.1 hypothetical protein SAMN05216553_10653 [Lentzea fradiae]
MGGEVHYDIEDHPDLQDSAWTRRATRRARREIRGQRRRAFLRGHSGKIITAVALVAVGATVAGLYRAGTFDDVSMPDVDLPYSGVNVEQPFAGTPAEHWSDGERGIVLPSTDPAFEQVRQALVAARIDPVTISEHKPDKFLAALAPQARDHYSQEFEKWVTRLKPGTKLLPNGIRVSGKMTLGESNGHQAVTTDYVFAYAFEPPDPKKLFDQMEIVAAVRTKVTYEVTPEGLWPVESSGFQYSIACQASKDGFLAPQFTEPAKHLDGLDDDEAHFSVDGPVPTDGNCE